MIVNPVVIDRPLTFLQFLYGIIIRMCIFVYVIICIMFIPKVDFIIWMQRYRVPLWWGVLATG